MLIFLIILVLAVMLLAYHPISSPIPIIHILLAVLLVVLILELVGGIGPWPRWCLK